MNFNIAWKKYGQTIAAWVILALVIFFSMFRTGEFQTEFANKSDEAGHLITCPCMSVVVV